MANSDAVMLSIGAIHLFTQELEMTLNISIDRVATLSLMIDKIRQNDNKMQGLAETVVLKHKGMIEDVDNQINYWLSLELTDAERDAIHHCQTLAQRLHKVQMMYERSYQQLIARAN